MSRTDIDSIDRKLLRYLQKDATATLESLADRIALSPTACWRRIKRLEDSEVIQARVTLLSASALEMKLFGFVHIRTNNHSKDWLARFTQHIAALPQVMEFHRMAGDVDYLLKIVAADIAAYDEIYRNIIQMPDLRDVSASFSMEQIKFTTELPLC